MSDPARITDILASIEKVAPGSSARAEKLRERVLAITDSPEGIAFHRHLLSEALAFALAIGMERSDHEAAYQASMAIFLDATATTQAVCGRLFGSVEAEAPARLALSAYTSAEHVLATRGDHISGILEEFHPTGAGGVA